MYETDISSGKQEHGEGSSILIQKLVLQAFSWDNTKFLRSGKHGDGRRRKFGNDLAPRLAWFRSTFDYPCRRWQSVSRKKDKGGRTCTFFFATCPNGSRTNKSSGRTITVFSLGWLQSETYVPALSEDRTTIRNGGKRVTRKNGEFCRQRK